MTTPLFAVYFQRPLWTIISYFSSTRVKCEKNYDEIPCKGELYIHLSREEAIYPVKAMASAIINSSICSPLILSLLLFFSSSILSSISHADARHVPYTPTISSIVSEELFNSTFLHKDDSACPAKGFYTYSSFVQAAQCFPRFGNTGGLATRKREVAAFLAQISHETTGIYINLGFMHT